MRYCSRSPDFPWNPVRPYGSIFGPCEKSRRRDRFAGCRWGRTIPRSAGVVRRYPRASSSSTCGSCFTSFVSKETDACCVRRRIVIGKNAGTTDTGLLICRRQNRQPPFHFPDALRHLVDLQQCHSCDRNLHIRFPGRLLFISAIRRSEFRKAAWYDAHAGEESWQSR